MSRTQPLKVNLQGETLFKYEFSYGVTSFPETELTLPVFFMSSSGPKPRENHEDGQWGAIVRITAFNSPEPTSHALFSCLQLKSHCQKTFLAVQPCKYPRFCLPCAGRTRVSATTVRTRATSQPAGGAENAHATAFSSFMM